MRGTNAPDPAADVHSDAGKLDRLLSVADAEAEVEAFTQHHLGLSSAEAFEMLDAGQLCGTLAEAELEMYRFLLGKARTDREAS